jgi:hypothetical protein
MASSCWTNSAAIPGPSLTAPEAKVQKLKKRLNSMSDSNSPSVFRTLRKWLNIYGEWSTVYGLIILAAPFIVSYYRLKAVGFQWENTVPYFVWLGSWLLGTAAVSAAVLKFGQSAASSIKWRLYPPLLPMTAEGGKDEAYAKVECTRGVANNIKVDGRIVRTLDGSLNPFPQPFSCYISVKGRDALSGSSARLHKTQWALIKLAWLARDSIIYIQKGATAHDSEKVGNGAVLELKLYIDGRLVQVLKVKIQVKHDQKSGRVVEVSEESGTDDERAHRLRSVQV